jgi:hypothetical protein
MKNLLVVVGVLACTSFFCVESLTSAQTTGKKAPAATAPAGPTKRDCLNCHGPFEKLVASSDKWVAPSGEKTSPHRYVPHDSKKDEDIPECLQCHTAHAPDAPPAHGTVDLSKVKVDYCYETCHHEKNFTSCKQCHS